MKLITEEVQDLQILVEADEKGNKNHYISGIFLQAEQVNKNGRVYPYKILDREINRYNKDYIEKKRALGELGHPQNPQINLDRVSHMITKLYPDGNNFIGKAKILNTPNGKIVQDLLEAGVSLGVSTRGVGSLKPQNGYQLVQDDYHLATAADIVAEPSAPQAYVQGIMEGIDWFLTKDGNWEKHVNESKNMIRKASRNDIERVSLQVWNNFISNLRNKNV